MLEPHASVLSETHHQLRSPERVGHVLSDLVPYGAHLLSRQVQLPLLDRAEVEESGVESNFPTNRPGVTAPAHAANATGCVIAHVTGGEAFRPYLVR